VFPELERHFILTGQGFTTESHEEITLGFVNIASLLHAFKENLHYPVIEQQMEFLKSAKILYDTKGHIATVLSKEFPDWATKKLIKDSLVLARWNIDKYKKAVKSRSTITSELLKYDAIWYCTKAIAALNNIPLVYKYGYDDFKVEALNQENNFLAPENFFNIIESAASNFPVLELLIDKIEQLINKII
jgi:hypothetical protein